jgi:hypothetical protein
MSDANIKTPFKIFFSKVKQRHFNEKSRKRLGV